MTYTFRVELSKSRPYNRSVVLDISWQSLEVKDSDPVFDVYRLL